MMVRHLADLIRYRFVSGQGGTHTNSSTIYMPSCMYAHGHSRGAFPYACLGIDRAAAFMHAHEFVVPVVDHVSGAD